MKFCSVKHNLILGLILWWNDSIVWAVNIPQQIWCCLDVSCSNLQLSGSVPYCWREETKSISNMWHDQGEWVTCRKKLFLFSYPTFSNLQNASFWCKPHYNWIFGYGVMKDLTMLKTIKQRNLNTVFANISKTTSLTSDWFLLIMSHILSLSSATGSMKYRYSSCIYFQNAGATFDQTL